MLGASGAGKSALLGAIQAVSTGNNRNVLQLNYSARPRAGRWRFSDCNRLFLLVTPNGRTNRQAWCTVDGPDRRLSIGPHTENGGGGARARDLWGPTGTEIVSCYGESVYAKRTDTHRRPRVLATDPCPPTGQAGDAIEAAPRSHPRSLIVGIAAAVASAAIAAGWQVATRAGLSTGEFTAIDLAVFRYAIPALVLLPLLLRHGLWPSTASPWLAVPLLVGGGLPFGLLAMLGAQLAPVAHMGALLAGTMPLFTALLAWKLLGEQLGRRQVAGFLVVSLGIALITGTSLAGFGLGTLAGDGVFILAALTWAIFTVAFRAADVPPAHAVALISVASTVIALPLWFATGTTRLLDAPAGALLWLAGTQGVLAGLAGFWTFAVAIRHLGAIGAALSGSMVPVLSALGGVVFLSEVPGPLVLAGVVATVFGIFAVTWPRIGRNRGPYGR